MKFVQKWHRKYYAATRAIIVFLLDSLMVDLDATSMKNTRNE